MFNSTCELYGWNEGNITHIRDSGINSGHLNGWHGLKSENFLFNVHS